MNMASINRVLRGLLVTYHHTNLALNDIRDVLTQFKDLRPTKKSYTYSNGEVKHLVCLEGTIPVSYKTRLYNIPIVIWLYETHPYHAPMVYVQPTTIMNIKAGPHVARSGLVTMPYITEWQYGKSDLPTLVSVLCMIFGESPPVFAKPKNQQPTQATSLQPPAYSPYPAVSDVVSKPYSPSTPGSNPFDQPAQHPYPSATAFSSLRPYPGMSDSYGAELPSPLSPSYGHPVQRTTNYPHVQTTLAQTCSDSSMISDTLPVQRQRPDDLSEEEINKPLKSDIGDQIHREINNMPDIHKIELDVFRNTKMDLIPGKPKLEVMSPAEKNIPAVGYRCEYCYLEFNSMAGLRELPCHHAFCVTCLQGDSRDNSNICCPSCQYVEYPRKVYIMETFDDLPTAGLDAEEVVDTPKSLTCDCHNCDGQIAVCYCVECAHKICATHKKIHETFFGDIHQLINTSMYEQSPGLYKRVLCSRHDDFVIDVCDQCHQQACLRCDKNSSCPGNAHHSFSSLTSLKEEITAHFNNLLQSANDKLTEICRIDKQIWKILDDEEVECKEKIEMIERIRDEQIEVIREESEKLKERIYEYQRRLTEQVELYNSELMVKKERLEESHTKVHRWLRESHVTEKIQQKQLMTDELRNNTVIDTDYELTKTAHIICTGQLISQNIALVNPPTSITLKSKPSTHSQCLSACYKKDGDLLLGCSDGVRLLRQDNMKMIRYNTDDSRVSNVMEHQKNIFVLRCDGDLSTVEMCLPGVEQREKLVSFTSSGEMALSIAISDQYVVAVNLSKEQLTLYDFLTKQIMILCPTTPPWKAHFLPDGDLLVVSKFGKFLTRYKIENKQLTTIWTLDRLDNARTVCTDADGLIYVCTSNKTLFILSPDGVKIQEIRNEQLPEQPGIISIKGRDELAVPSWSGNSVCLFKINH